MTALSVGATVPAREFSTNSLWALSFLPKGSAYRSALFVRSKTADPWRCVHLFP